MTKNYQIGLGATIRREFKRLYSRPLYLFCMIIAPLFCTFFFTTLMADGLPSKLPIGAVDLDHSSTSRNLLRNLDAFQQVDIIQQFNSVQEAKNAMQRNEIYGFFYIPEDFASNAQSQRQPTLSFYTNDAFLIAGSLLFKNMKTMGEMASGSATLSVLLAKGLTKEQVQAVIMPISIDSRPLNNPWLNYSVYLSNTILPGILSLMVLMITVFSIGSELKENSSWQWLRTGNKSIFTALLGKLIPQTVIWLLVGGFILVYMYGYLSYPCNSGILPMFLAMTCLILASQGLAIFIYGVAPILRLALSAVSLWGVLSFSISGFSFPIMAMDPTLQVATDLFPLRHYFLIYVNSALNGYSIGYAWTNYAALLIFMLLPLLVLRRLKKVLIYFKHID